MTTDPARSKIMRSVRRKDTMPEIKVRSAAHALGLRFRLHRCDLPGSPDLIFPRWRTVIFVHGCFWHRHPGCFKASTPKTRIEFWEGKFKANVARDKRVIKELRAMGWRVAIIWECETGDKEELQRKLEAIFKNSTLPNFKNRYN